MTTCCPLCGSDHTETFYDIADVPVHSVLLHHSRADALAIPRGRLQLAACARCDFVFNRSFDESLLNYNAAYESTQHFSPTFSGFAQEQAQHLIDKYDLHGKYVVEVGCGQGEFIELLCRLGDNHGVGYDPAYRGDPSRLDGHLQFIAADFSGETAVQQTDFICCKMTLEHIAQPAAFLTNIRRAIAANTVVFFQIPNGEAVLNDLAFWDIYYEHCSYFGRASLRYLFEMSGLRVLDLYVTYGDQYLVVEAAPSDAQSPIIPPDERAAAQNSLRHFRENISAQLGRWQQTIQQFHGERLVLWGGGSKAVALLNTLAIRDEVAYVIDINPQKHQTFLAGTGHAVMNPPHLEDAPPDVILLMNPMYRDEVQRMVAAQMGQCRIVTVQDEF